MFRHGVLLLPLLCGAPVMGQCDLEILSHRGGAPQCVDRVGNRVHCVFGDELLVLDITNPSPRLLGSVLLPAGDARDIDVADGYAYIVAGHNGLIVVDVATPASPTIVAEIPVDQSVTTIVVSNARAFVCGEQSDEDSVFLLDLSDPAAPVVADIYHVSDGSTKGVAISGDTLFAGCTSSVDIVDVSDLENPVRLGVYDADAFVVSLDAAGDTLFVETVLALEAVDVSNTSAPVQLSTYETDMWGHFGVNAAGTLAYVEGFSDIEVIDVSIPAAPRHRATIENTNGVDLRASGAYLFHADALDGLVMWDCTNPDSPTQLWTLDLRPTSPTGFDANDSWMVYAENQELVVFDATVPGSPSRTATIKLGSNSARLVLSGDLLYETDRSAGLQIFDLAAAGGPVVIGSAPTGLYPERLALSGPLLLVALLDGTLQVFDVSDPAAPVLRGSVVPPDPDSTAGLVAEDGFAYMLRYESGINIFDVNDPDAPLFVRTISATDEAYHASVHDHLLSLTRSNPFGANDTVVFYDVADPANPVFRGAYGLTSSYGSSTTFHDSTLIVSEASVGIHFVDVSDPAAPRLMRDFVMGSGAVDAVPTSDRLWVLGSGSGLWETTLPGDPRVVASPADADVCAGFIASFHVDATGAAAYFWRRNGVPLLNGATGHGSIINGAFTDTLRILATRADDIGNYDCTVLNACGFIRSAPAALGVTACCAADFNNDGVINSGDFFAYIAAFFAADPAADLNADGAVTSQDFFDFLGAFFAGC